MIDDNDHSLESPTWRTILAVYAAAAVICGILWYTA